MTGEYACVSHYMVEIRVSTMSSWQGFWTADLRGNSDKREQFHCDIVHGKKKSRMVFFWTTQLSWTSCYACSLTFTLTPYSRRPHSAIFFQHEKRIFIICISLTNLMKPFNSFVCYLAQQYTIITYKHNNCNNNNRRSLNMIFRN